MLKTIKANSRKQLEIEVKSMLDCFDSKIIKLSHTRDKKVWCAILEVPDLLQEVKI